MGSTDLRQREQILTDSNPLDLKLIAGWLNELSRLVRQGEEKVTKDQLAVYASMLARDLPRGAFSTRTLHLTACDMTWWPDYATLRKKLLDQWQLDRAADTRLIAAAPGSDDLDENDRSWLAYFQKREAENFIPVKPGALWGRDHVLSLVKQQAPRAYRKLMGEAARGERPAPTEEEREYVANLLRPWRQQS